MPGYEAIVEYVLLVGGNWPDVVVEDQLVEMAFQDDEDDSHSHLDNSGCEEVFLADQRKMQPVLEVANRQHFLPGVGFYQFPVYFLLPLPEILVGMFEQFLHGRVIASFPVGLPPEIDRFELGEEVGMHVFEVEGICAIGGDVLEGAVDVVLGFASVDQVVFEFRDVHHGVLGLGAVLFHGVDPDIDIPVHLYDRVFFQGRDFWFVIFPF